MSSKIEKFERISEVKRLVRWLAFRVSTLGREAKVPPTPAFTPADFEWFSQKIKETKFYLEFGSGSSTTIAAQFCCKTVSIESDQRFADAVVRALSLSSRATVVHADIGLVGAWGYPVFQRQRPAKLNCWRAYTDLAKLEVDRFGSFPDLVLIDGRFRLACALSIAAWAAEARASTTIMFDDYRDRPQYHAIEEHLGSPRLMPSRAAIFEIQNGALLKPVTLNEIEKAHLDVR